MCQDCENILQAIPASFVLTERCCFFCLLLRSRLSIWEWLLISFYSGKLSLYSLAHIIRKYTCTISSVFVLFFSVFYAMFHWTLHRFLSLRNTMTLRHLKKKKFLGLIRNTMTWHHLFIVCKEHDCRAVLMVCPKSSE